LRHLPRLDRRQLRPGPGGARRARLVGGPPRALPARSRQRRAPHRRGLCALLRGPRGEGARGGPLASACRGSAGSGRREPQLGRGAAPPTRVLSVAARGPLSYFTTTDPRGTALLPSLWPAVILMPGRLPPGQTPTISW